MTWHGPDAPGQGGFTYPLVDGASVPRRLSSMHARTICHATEDAARVEQALRTVVGDSAVERSSTEGHHGNVVEVLESSVDDEAKILDMLGRMSPEDLAEIGSTLDERMDDACQVFLRLDKQEAYAGRLRLTVGEDVVAVRLKVRAYPAKRAIASKIVRDLLEEVTSTRRPDLADPR